MSSYAALTVTPSSNGTAVWGNNMRDRVLIPCTSTTRPSPSVTGMHVWESDTGAVSLCVSGGTPGTWVTLIDTQWRSFTPNIGFFIGGGGSGWSEAGGYKIIGRNLVEWEAYATFTVSMIMSGQLCVTLPFTPATAPANLGQHVGSGRVLGVARRSVTVVDDHGNPGLGLVELPDASQVAGSSSGIWGSTVGGYCAVKFSGRYRI